MPMADCSAFLTFRLNPNFSEFLISLASLSLLSYTTQDCSGSWAISDQSLIKKIPRAGEMAQQLRALAVLVEDQGSIPSTHMAVHNCL